jgi:hypothetical protein
VVPVEVVIEYRGSELRTLPHSQAEAIKRILRREGEKFSTKENKIYIRTKSAMHIALAF